MDTENNKPVLTETGKLSEEEIAALKREHNEIVEIWVRIGDDKAYAYLRHPTRDEYAFATTLQNANRSFEAGEHLLRSCFVKGDSRLQDPKGHMESKAAMKAAVLATHVVNLPDGGFSEK